MQRCQERLKYSSDVTQQQNVNTTPCCKTVYYLSPPGGQFVLGLGDLGSQMLQIVKSILPLEQKSRNTFQELGRFHLRRQRTWSSGSPIFDIVLINVWSFCFQYLIISTTSNLASVIQSLYATDELWMQPMCWRVWSLYSCRRAIWITRHRRMEHRGGISAMGWISGWSEV